jgi:curved DNA-binding protein CbpA
MSEGITLYDVLGVPAGASADTIRQARDERRRQLRPGLEAGAPSPVVTAARRARETSEFAALVLGDPELRRRYDEEIGLHRDRGLRPPGETLAGSGDPYGPLRAGVGLLPAALAASFEAVLGWMAPHRAAPPRRVIVPDVRGLFFRPCQAVATMAGLRVRVVRLTAHPLPVEGLVAGQWPAPGQAARRESELTVEVWHPGRPG